MVNLGAFRLALLLLASAGLMACGGSTSEGPDGFTAACDDGQPVTASGFDPATAVDFIGMRSESTFPRAATAARPPTTGGSSGTTTTNEAAWTATLGSDQRGTPCTGPGVTSTCAATLASLRLLGDTCDGLKIVPQSNFGGVAFAGPGPQDAVAGAAEAAALPRQQGSCATSYYVYTRGDVVGTIQKREEARQFFGAINTADEALYLLGLSGESISCQTRWKKSDGDGFDVQPQGAGGNRRTVHVASDGTTTVR